LKKGDLVRFKKYPWEKKIGILIEYKKWEKVATILYNGITHRVRAENVEKAGKRDFLVDNISQ